MNPVAPLWDLSDLFTGPDDPNLQVTLDAVKADAEAFARSARGTLAALSPASLAANLSAWESLHQRAGKTGAFASLHFSTDSSPEGGAFLQRIREATTAATLPLLFFPIELAALGVKRLDELAADPALSGWAHHLHGVRDHARFQLSEPEERILEETANTGRRALTRLFDETTGNVTVSVEGVEKTISEALDLQRAPDRAVRAKSSAALGAALTEKSGLIAFLQNNLVQAKATDDRLRGYEYPEQARHLSNELTPEIVETVAKVVEAGYPLVARYYNAKKKLLGLDELAHYDRYAPLPDAPSATYSWDEARETILGAFAAFDPEYAALGKTFFDNPWIDAGARPGKKGGAFCSYVAPDHHPYLFSNFLGSADDVQTLAHELGHGIHALLSRGQKLVYFYGTLPMAEVASTFAEQLVFSQLLARSTDPLEKRALYARRIEGSLATIFRQISMYRFEQAIHAERKNGELTVERIGELWQEKVGAMFAGSVVLGDDHKTWWSYVGHFIHTPFYVYAYAFGELLALALYTRGVEEGAGFVPKYLQMLSLAGSQPPQKLVEPLGVDLAQESFWLGALRVLEDEVASFEKLLD